MDTENPFKVPEFSTIFELREKEIKARHQEYIAQRREMFFLEYAIGIQSAEITRLQNLLKQEEQKLDIAEQCLEQDAALFDEFLKENDKNSVEAIAAAELESRKRSTMGEEIRRLTAQQMHISAEMNRLKEIVKEYKSYEAFLERLIPEKPRLERESLRKEKKEAKIRAKLATKRTIEDSRKASINSPRGSLCDSRRTSFVLRRRSTLRQVSLNFAASRKAPPVPKKTESDTSSSDESDSELYFTSPNQVMEILWDLEEGNLRLIRNCQETQEGIDELKNVTHETKERIESDTAVLVRHHRSLATDIQKEVDRAKDLSLDTNAFVFAGLQQSEQKRVLNELQMQISQVYRTCIQKADASLSSSQLLNEIEASMVDLLQQLEQFPEEDLKLSFQAKEKEHRLHVKEERKREQRIHQEERIRKALERAKAEPKKRTGRRVMSRSEPPRVERDDSVNLEALQREEEELAFLFK